VAATEWFRRTTWLPEDQEAFFARLGRSRSTFHKSQYLRIQAGHLEDTNQPELVRAALALLDTLLRDWPEPSQLACAHHQRATCHIRLGEASLAVQSFRDALAAELAYPNAVTQAAIAFPWLVATSSMATHYSEALEVLSKNRNTLLFPIERFKFHGASALILSAVKRGSEAAAQARQALEAAAATESGLRYHQSLGLVGDAYGEVVKHLRELAAVEQPDAADEVHTASAIRPRGGPRS